MSIVATPPSSHLPHQSFSDTELFTASGSVSAHAELPPSLPQQPISEGRSTPALVPFPVFQHRHSSPFPMAQSFSALGPAPELRTRPPSLSTTAPPPAPKTQPMTLPSVAPDGSELFIRATLPPTPDPSPPNSKVLFADAMVKLAPRATDEKYDLRPTEDLVVTSNDTPRVLPTISIDSGSGSSNGEQITFPFPAVAGPGPSTVNRARAATQSVAIRSDATSSTSTNGKAHQKSMGPPTRPIRRSQTAVHPSAVRMTETRSADSRARLRSAVMSPRQSSGQLVVFGRASSPGLPRALTAPLNDTSSTPPRSFSAIETSTPDMGGPEGLEAKVVLLGSQGVGKTSLILRYTTRVFSSTRVAATIGSSLHTRKLVQGGVRVKLQIWDTAGQERFRSMAPIYYRGAHVCVLVYDTTDQQSFQDVKSWLEELNRTVPKETAIYIVGSKVDLPGKRVISHDEACRTIRDWLKPPPPVSDALLSPVSSKNLFRSSSLASRTHTNTSSAGNTSVLSSPTPTRSHSHTALTSLNPSTTTIPAPRQSLDSNLRLTTVEPPATTAARKPFPVSPSSATRPSTLQITTAQDDPLVPTSPRVRRISFPALQSPTLPTSVTFTEPIKPSITPASPPSRHGISGGRFSISGVLGYSRTTSIGGAASNLARLAEDFPVSPRGLGTSNLPESGGRSRSFGADSPVPPRTRVESSPLLSHDQNRRKSEDWSSRSWRMGEGPGAAEALGEFGAGVRKKQSGDLLGATGTPTNQQAGGAKQKQKQGAGGRSRGGSLGRDSRLYGSSNSGDSDDEDPWGVDVEGMKVGEVSALTGDGVEALFRSISALLVDKREKIERDRTLRRKDSVMLIDPSKDSRTAKGKSKGGCCV